MGIPSVLTVALLAVVGFWFTLHAPDRLSAVANPGDAAANAVIPRGCLLPDASHTPELCRDASNPPVFLDAAPTGPKSVCKSSQGDYFVEVWEDASGRRGIHWSLPPLVNPTHPVGATWLAAYHGADAFPVGIRFGPETRSGWAAFPANFPAEGTLVVRSGSVGLGGSLQEGLRALKVVPFGVKDTGEVRLAAYVNGGSIVMEIPPAAPFELVKAKEQLRFDQSPILGLECGSG